MAGIEQQAFIDIDSLLRPVYGYTKQGVSYGHVKIGGRSLLRKGLSPRGVSDEQATAVVIKMSSVTQAAQPCR